MPWLRTFDSTKGFPGEGPEDRKDWKIAFANVTAIRSLWEELQREGSVLQGVDILCIQEHHIASMDAMGEWQDRFHSKGWTFMGSKAEPTVGKTGKAGSRAGVGVLFRRHLRVHSFKEVSARFVHFKIDIGALGVIRIGTGYGGVANSEQDKAMIKGWFDKGPRAALIGWVVQVG